MLLYCSIVVNEKRIRGGLLKIIMSNHKRSIFSWLLIGQLVLKDFFVNRSLLYLLPIEDLQNSKLTFLGVMCKRLASQLN
jgi:hypothetical protein